MAKKTLEQRRKEAEQQLRRNAATFAEGVEATRQAQQGSASNATMTAEKEREILDRRAAESSARQQTADTSQQAAARTQALDLRANRYRAGAMSAYGSVFGTPERSRYRSDEELAKAAKDFLDSGDTSNQKGFLKQYSATEQDKLRRYLNQYQQEAAQSAEEQQQRASYLRGLDVASAQSELDDLNKRLDNAARAKKAVGDNLSQVNRVMPGSSLWQQLNEDVDALQTQRDQLQRDVSEASRLQTSDRYAALKGNSDFSEGVRRGEELTHNDSLQTWMGRGSSTGYMTEDEWDTFNYLRGTQGDAASQEYLDFLREELNRREGQYEAEQVRDTGNYGPFGRVGRGVVTGLYGVAAGLDQAASGARQTAENIFGEGDKLPTSSLQYGSSYIGQDLEDTGAKIGSFNLSKAGYDVINTTANMLPSILASYATGGIAGGLGAGTKAASLLSRAAGGAAMATSVYGNAYNQALQDGYTKEQANAYGLLSAASETGLQYALGGITALGGTVTNSVGQKLVANISSPAVQALARVGINSLGEGSEEYLQEIIDPLFRNLVFQEGNQFKAYTPEAAYAFLLGALSAGLIEAPTQLRTPETIASAGRGVMESGHTDDLFQRALAMPEKSVSHRRAAAMQNSAPDEQSVGYLLDAYQQDGGDLSFLTQPPVPTPDNTETVASAVETLPMSDQAAQPQRPQTLPMVDRAGQTVQQQAAQTVQGATLPTAQPTTQAAPAAQPQQVTTLPMREQESSGLYTTSIDTDPSTHTPEENARIQEYTRSTDSKIVSFINRVLGLKNRNFRNKVNLEFAPVSDRAAADILSMTGVDASGFTHELTGRAVDHIIERHGSEGEADSSMRDVNDIARIGYVLENYDFATLLRNKDGSVRTTTSYRMADNSPAPVMQFVKKIDGNYYAVEAVTDAKAHHLGVLSAYMANANGGGQVLGMGQTAPRSITSQTGLDRNSSTLNISQQGAAVNPDYSALEAQDTARLTADPAQAASQAEGNSETARPRIHSQFFAEPGMAEGDFPIDSARLNRMVQRANEVVDAALAERVLTRDEVQSTVAAMLAQDFRMAPGAADSLAARFADQYQAVIDQGSARLYQEMQEGDGRFRPSQANRTLQNAVQMTPEELDAAGMDMGGEQYMTRSEAFSNRQAQSIIEQNGWDGAYDYLMQNDRWNPADVKAAVAVSQHFLEQARSATDAATRSELYDKVGQLGMRYVQDRSAAGRALQASAEFAGDPVMDAITRITRDFRNSEIWEKLSKEQRSDLIREISEDASEIEAARAKAEQNDGKEELIGIINRYARDRGVTKTVLRGQNRDVRRMVQRWMSKVLSVEELTQYANASMDAYLVERYGRKPNAGDYMKTLQVLSHLFRPTTWFRNIHGNLSFTGLDTVNNRLATIFDIFTSHRTGTRSFQHSRALLGREAWSASKQAFMKSAIAVYLDLDVSGETNRYGRSNTRTFRMNGSKLSVLTRVLSHLERDLSYFLTSTDQFSKGGIQATQQRVTQEMLDSGAIDVTRLGDVSAEDFAAQRGKDIARFRTFQDNSRLAEIAQGVHDLFNFVGVGDSGRRSRGGHVIHSYGLGDVVIAYPRVPGNVVSRALEYSPVGFAKGAYDWFRVIKDGKNATVQEQTHAILEASRGVVGSAMIALAFLISKWGLIKSTEDDDNEDEKRLNRSEGVNGLQINLSALLRGFEDGGHEWRKGDVLVSVDFLQPANAWLSMGCFIDSWLDGDKEYDAMTGSLEAFGRSIEDFPALDFLQGVLNDMQYQDMGIGNALATETVDSITSTLVPSVVRGLATGTDQYQRDTSLGAQSLYDWINQSTGMKGGFIKAIATQAANTMSAVPWLRKTLPIKQDNYGRNMQYTGNKVLDFINNMVSPGSIYVYSQDPLTKELASVSSYTGTTTFYPNRTAASSVSYQNETHEMSVDERQKYQETYGTVYYSLASELIDSQEYQSADYMTRAYMLSEIESIASAQARVEYMDSIGVDYSGSESAKLIAKMDDYFSTGMTFGQYYDWKARMAEFSGDTKQADILSALSGSGLSEAQQEAIYYNMGGYSISDEKQAEGTSVGLTEDDLKYWRYRIDQAQAAGTDDSQLLWQIYQSVDLSDEQKNMVAKLFLSDATVIPKETDVDFSSYDSFLLSQLPETAQTRYQVYAKDYLSPEEWSEIYNTFSGYRTKTQMQQAMLAAGLSQSDADILYSWISGSLDDSYYVGQMTETAQYVWSQALESADIMSAKQWLEYSGNYSGQDYDTILAELLNDGWAQATAQTLAQILSQM